MLQDRCETATFRTWATCSVALIAKMLVQLLAEGFLEVMYRVSCFSLSFSYFSFYEVEYNTRRFGRPSPIAPLLQSFQLPEDEVFNDILSKKTVYLDSERNLDRLRMYDAAFVIFLRSYRCVQKENM